MKARTVYSGEKSEEFWNRINAIPDKVGLGLYALACDLQDLEGQVLELLTEAEGLKGDEGARKKLKKKLKRARKVKRR